MVDCVQYQIQLCSGPPSCSTRPRRTPASELLGAAGSPAASRIGWGRIHHGDEGDKPLDQQRKRVSRCQAAPVQRWQQLDPPPCSCPHHPGPEHPCLWPAAASRATAIRGVLQ
ncbi:hypothetical protein BM449_00475 [Synechococcus sp. SynAce01]|nr:hypothetical protein BM449_00475 [Synechococcus sp. SynAce01]